MAQEEAKLAQELAAKQALEQQKVATSQQQLADQQQQKQQELVQVTNSHKTNKKLIGNSIAYFNVKQAASGQIAGNVSEEQIKAMLEDASEKKQKSKITVNNLFYVHTIFFKLLVG
ncbi:DNA-binding protein [Reticulomyxa filosa]|uniref:DNA-binding protein n=1 Tax=Reticulomyxa filosa TaxID=46433 RepID=X6NE94_RETFI|nr:DNA-binding protein [Reticulomyxa filosa]|eukprot:ETO24291.1 DNA-binding protein [Reticulomyxa filosa]